MMNYRDENPAELAFVVSLIKKILLLVNCAQHYRVDIKDGSIFIRESTQYRPPQRRSRRFQVIVNALAAGGFVRLRLGEIRGIVNEENVIIPFYRLDQINIEKFFQLLGLAGPRKPQGVEEKIWMAIPNEIKAHWSQFSVPMQEHIIVCCTPNAEENFDNLLQSKLITDSLRSPVTFAVPKIPVRLPNMLLERKVGNEVYDLMDILNLKQRDPDHPEKRLDPMNRQPFSLNEVIPDPEARERILQKGHP